MLKTISSWSFALFVTSQIEYLAHVIEQPNFRIPNPQYFVYLLDQTVGRDTLQFIYWNHAPFSNSFKISKKPQNVFSVSLKNQNKNFVVNIGDSEFGNLVVRWREQDKFAEFFLSKPRCKWIHLILPVKTQN